VDAARNSDALTPMNFSNNRGATTSIGLLLPIKELVQPDGKISHG